MKKIITLFFVVILVVSLSGCSSCFGPDGICDHAGCKKEATCDFGGEMEFCLKHYIEWTDRAYKSNRK